ncbi:MAG: metallophosphoesterase family protein [Bacillota bacterium]
MHITDYFSNFFLYKYLPTLIMTIYIIIIVGLFVFLTTTHIQASQNNEYIKYPKVKFAVITDPHVFDVTGNVKNPLYLKYGVQDRKLLGLSTEILETAVQQIVTETNVDFVILSGDLTDSGDIISHKAVANILKKFTDNNIKVYIIPGNHDGFNTIDFEITTIPREIITPLEFTKLYENFGYKTAIYKDEHSLSYVAEPVEGLWFFMIDSCIYNDENNYHVCNGRIRESTIKWIEQLLMKANEENIAVIGSLHHSLLEHYKGQQKFFSNYIVDDFDELSSNFAARNMKIVFTGHHHALDIAKKEFGNNSFIYDIETSSLIGFPNAYRIVEINKNNEMIIQSKYIKEIPSFEGDFNNYTKEYVRERVKNVAKEKLDRYYLNTNNQDKILDKAADAMMAHYQGNETSTQDLDIEGLNIWSKFIYRFYKNLLEDLYEDPPPNDLNIKIDLNTGEWINID